MQSAKRHSRRPTRPFPSEISAANRIIQKDANAGISNSAIITFKGHKCRNPTAAGHTSNPNPPAMAPLNENPSPGNQCSSNGPITTPLNQPISNMINVGGISCVK